MNHTDLYHRTLRAVEVRESLVRAGVEWLERHGVHPISAAVLIVWYIERQSTERIARHAWPA